MNKLLLNRNTTQILIVVVMMLSRVVTYSTFCLAQTKMVGSLGGEINVSPTGTAAYSIPIEVAPGTNGMQPNLAITYNSAMGRGMLGMGWTLSGFSSITRTQRNKYYDGVIGSVNFNENDRFSLDGKRLIKVTGVSNIYMATNTVYGTEIEDFTRVTLIGNPNHQDSMYFNAVTEQGHIIEYGTNTNSKIKLPQGVILAWMANKITDADGNYMTIIYNKNDTTGENWPVQINYTGNNTAHLTPYASVQFLYTNDPNANKTYIGGNPVTSTKLLTAIVVKYGSAIIRQYGFEYDFDRSSRLTAVVLKDDEGSELTRTTINWGEDLNSTNIRNVNGIVNQGKYLLDYNSDGIPDLLLTTRLPVGYLWTIKEGQRDGTFQTTNHSGNIGIFSSLFPVDFDGDGQDGFGYVFPKANSDSCIFKVKELKNGSFIDVFTSTKKSSNFLIGDFLGHGGVQFLFIGEPSFNSCRITNSFDNQQLSVPSNALLSVTDLNGNGKADLQVVRNNYIDVYEYDEPTNAFVKILDGLWLPNNPSRGFHGDFNGDGMVDYIYFTYTNNHGSWYLKISKGNDYRETDSLPFETFHGNTIYPEYPLLISDINGDGKDDIIQPTLSGSTILNVYYSHKYNNNGDGLLFDTIQVRLNDVYQYKENYFQFADLDQDGKNELFYKGSGNQLAMIISFPEQRKHDLILNITNGLGMTTSVDYQYHNSPMIGYLGGEGKRIHYPLVSQLTQPDGIGGTNETTLSYGYAVFDYDRQQLLGFQYFNSHCNGTNTRNEYQKDNSHHHLDLAHSLTYYLLRNENGGVIPDTSYWQPGRYFSHYETLYAPCYLNLSNGRFIPYSSSTTIANKLQNSAKTDNYCLNSEGRVSSITSTYKKAKSENGSYPWIVRDSTVYTYVNVGLPNGQTVVKPSMVKTWNRRNGYSQIPFHQSVFSYISGRINTETLSDSDGSIGVMSYTYNNVGLPLTETYTPDGMTARTKSFSYDNKRRFLIQETDVLGHTQSTTYNDYTGLPEIQTDINNLSTLYKYDALGRVTTIIRPDNTCHDISYDWYTVGNFTNVVYYSRETEAGTPETRNYYDIFGRIIHTYCEGQGYNDIVYDKMGRMVQKTYIPYPTATATSKTWSYFSYDNYDRITEENSPYSDLSYAYYEESEPSNHEYFVSVTDSIRNTCQTKTYDALGRLMYAEDEGGTINYNYAYETASGKTRDKTTISIGNAVITIVSDIRGNRLSIQDPDAGTVTSSYDNCNQLVSKTDANGIQTSYTYDVSGRIVQITRSKNNTSETATYTYDNASGNGIGKLSRIHHDGNTERIYAYDNLGRIYNYLIDIDGTTFDHLYEYDTLGRLQFITYPDGFRIQQTYNSYGELATIRNASNNDLIYAIDTRNSFREPLKCQFGNETGTQYSYNSLGMLTGIRNGNVNIGNIINGGINGGQHEINYTIGSEYRDLTYTYNDRGFIASRSDATCLQSETYTYDCLDRLISYTINSSTTDTLSYSNSGNINTNSKVGVYSYNGTKPHAVTNIISAPERTPIGEICEVTYNLMNRPSTLTENAYSIHIDYDSEGERRHTEFFNGNNLVKEKNRISDLYEEESTSTTARRLDYIYAEGRTVAVRVTENGFSYFYYVMTDHLGSWNKVIDDHKTIVQQTHFDPWGNRMNYAAWDLPQTQTSYVFDRGFTGHEHYIWMNIINANARLYDPTIGRFFSPDPFVQAPDFTQAYNRYSYCMNNPVMYSDEDGEWVHIAIGAVVGGLVNLGIKAYQGKIHSIKDGFAAFGIGAAAGALGAATGGAAFTALWGGAAGAGGFIAGAGGAMMGTAFSSPVENIGNAIYFNDPLMTPKEYLVGIGISGLVGGAINGGVALYHGRSFLLGRVEAPNFTPTLPKPTLNIETTESQLNTEGLRTPMDMPQYSDSQIYYLENANHYTKEIDGIQFTLRDPNFRNNLISASGFDPGSAAQAHHVFPMKYAQFFESAGINPNSYGAWWGEGHLQNAYQYNQAWGNFFRYYPNANQQEIYSFAIKLKLQFKY